MPQKYVYFLVFVLRRATPEGLMFSRLLLREVGEFRSQDNENKPLDLVSQLPTNWDWDKVMSQLMPQYLYVRPFIAVERGDSLFNSKRIHHSGNLIATNAHLVRVNKKGGETITVLRNMFDAGYVEERVEWISKVLIKIGALLDGELSLSFGAGLEEIITQVAALSIPHIIPVGKSEWDMAGVKYTLYKEGKPVKK